jgi:hemerythrin-like domain-containing protein
MKAASLHILQGASGGQRVTIQIGAKPDSGFDDPLGMLRDCHRRIESFLKILCLVVERANARPLNAEEVAAVDAALQYFRTGGQRHTADEEVSLFPRLRISSAKPFEQLNRLESDHHEAATLHQSVEDLYSQWISTGALGADSHDRLLAETNQLKQLYAEHIRIEEDIVFPHAALALDRPTLAAIGSEFQQRRR